jgi:hypothetical protein
MECGMSRICAFVSPGRIAETGLPNPAPEKKGRSSQVVAGVLFSRVRFEMRKS